MVLLLEVDCLDINFGLVGIIDILVSLLVNSRWHVFSSQHCFWFPGPPNLALSLHNMQTPQSNRVELYKIHIISSSLLAQLCYYFM